MKNFENEEWCVLRHSCSSYGSVYILDENKEKALVFSLLGTNYITPALLNDDFPTFPVWWDMLYRFHEGIFCERDDGRIVFPLRWRNRWKRSHKLSGEANLLWEVVVTGSLCKEEMIPDFHIFFLFLVMRNWLKGKPN